MNYVVSTAQAFYEAYSQAKPGDVITVIVTDKSDFEFEIEYQPADQSETKPWSGCAC